MSEYKTWSGMKQRCYNPNAPGYQMYGARGISVCDRWKESFDAFISDMGPRPTPTHSLDRIDVNGNYELRNCRWATKTEQVVNRRKYSHVGCEKPSKFKGVSWNSQRRKWQAVVRRDGSSRWLGYFNSEEEAAKAVATYNGS